MTGRDPFAFDGDKLLTELFRDYVNKGEAMEWEGKPYVGDPFMVDKHKKPKLRRIANIYQFDMTSDKDKVKYARVMQSVADGLSAVSFEDRVYDKDIKSWRILLRWVDYVYENPDVVKERVNKANKRKIINTQE
jgi:hypothetical protein